MKKLTLIPVALLCLYISSFSQAKGNAVYDNTPLADPANSAGVDLSLESNSYAFSNLLEANVMANVKASSYIAIFSLTQNGNTIEETENMMRTRIELFKKTLEGENAGWHVFVDPVSLVPSYEIEVTEKRFSKTFNEIPSGFEIKKNVHITFTDHEQVNRLIAIAAKAEVYDLVKVDYVVENMDKVLNELRQEALRILMDKKGTVEKAGMKIRFTQVGERYGSVYPVERYVHYYAYKTGTTPSYVNRYKRSQQLEYNYADKNKTIYYEKVADKQFDKVINPAVPEPQVQVYITFKGMYELYDEKAEAENMAYQKKIKELQLQEMELNLQAKKKEIELKGKQVVKR
jgi:hypothetical protein